MVKKIIKIGVLVVIAGISFVISMVMTQQFGTTLPGSDTPDSADQVAVSEEIQILNDLANADATQLKPKEQQLDDLIRELRVKLKALDRRELELAKREERIRTAAANLESQIKEMEEIRMQLVTAIGPVKAARADLLRIHMLIREQDKANSEKLAKGWAKMEPAQVARLILEMWKEPASQDSATKIIYFLSDKQWAAVMDEVRDMGPAVEIVQRLQSVVRETDIATEGA